MNIDDTIAAIATAMGPAGIGVIRISGSESIAVTQSLFRPSRARLNLHQAATHRLYHGWIHDGEQPVDEVMITLMRAPRSYTTEDVVEIQCHGSVMVLQTILKLLLDQGIRLAQPGEFTQRAFFYGRLDLTQVEAVSDLIHARSRLGIQAAVNQLRGKLYTAIEAVKEQVAYVAALVEALIDFSDEDEEFTHRDDCIQRLGQARQDLEQLLASAERGKIMRSGLGTALIGRPNVGKSSLLNALLREKRAIVTDIPGTTRDVIEEAIQIQGLALRLIDTAGIRTTDNVVENEGIERSRQAWESADVVVLVLDASQPLTSEDERLLEDSNPHKTVIALNKKDLLPHSDLAWKDRLEGFDAVFVSATHGEGMDALEQALFRKGTHGDDWTHEQAMITNLRQQQAAQEALAALDLALEGLEAEVGEELLAVDLGSCLHALGKVVGETTADDLLNRIFAEFCIGK